MLEGGARNVHSHLFHMEAYHTSPLSGTKANLGDQTSLLSRKQLAALKTS